MLLNVMYVFGYGSTLVGQAAAADISTPSNVGMRAGK